VVAENPPQRIHDARVGDIHRVERVLNVNRPQDKPQTVRGARQGEVANAGERVELESVA
jgi:hypothetical protein